MANTDSSCIIKVNVVELAHALVEHNQEFNTLLIIQTAPSTGNLTIAWVTRVAVNMINKHLMRNGFGNFLPDTQVQFNIVDWHQIAGSALIEHPMNWEDVQIEFADQTSASMFLLAHEIADYQVRANCEPA
jgi:hypothetical protein